MNLISKKDLLILTGISYGQLYRWKRERLIPEEWFIKQSSYTGQETFFPREQILSRIQSILELKDEHSLEDLAAILSSRPADLAILAEDLSQIEEIDPALLQALPRHFKKERYSLLETGLIAAVSQLIRLNQLTPDQAAELISRCGPSASAQKSAEILCVIFSADGRFHGLFTKETAEMAFDVDVKIVGKLPAGEIAGKIKAKYNRLFVKN